MRLQDDARDNVEAIGALLIDGHDGSRIPLNQLATITKTFGPGAIRREAGSRRIAVEASVEGRDLKLPAGYFMSVGRTHREPAARHALPPHRHHRRLFAVFILLYLALGSTAEALVILATLPDAFVGGILALLIAGESWNVSSLVGLIGLFGVAVQNGLVLIASQRPHCERPPLRPRPREAAIGRVRPKLMTACTAILRLLPLLILRLHGIEIERPLAIVMISGLVTSTLFTLVALPTLYALVHWQTRLATRRAALVVQSPSPTVRA